MSTKYKKSSIQCPVCGSKFRKVMDSRAKAGGEGAFIRRRVQCSRGHRYTTYERPAWAWTQEDELKEKLAQVKAILKGL